MAGCPLTWNILKYHENTFFWKIMKYHEKWTSYNWKSWKIMIFCLRHIQNEASSLQLDRQATSFSHLWKMWKFQWSQFNIIYSLDFMIIFYNLLKTLCYLSINDLRMWLYSKYFLIEIYNFYYSVLVEKVMFFPPKCFKRNLWKPRRNFSLKKYLKIIIYLFLIFYDWRKLQ